MSEDTSVSEIVSLLKRYVPESDDTAFNYERFLVTKKRKHLDAFLDEKPFPPFEVEVQMSSKCNLECKWCIGDVVQSGKHVLNLPNDIKKDNVDNIIEGIINCDIGGLRIEAVKFSGFIGEPLITKKETIKAIRYLVGAGKRVGLFTNAMLMGPDTWETLLNIDYVHVSLDAGPFSFHWLKDSENVSDVHKSFDTVLDNISGLNLARQAKKAGEDCHLKINVGYVVVPGNHEEIFVASKRVKEAGADSIRFKVDIGGKYDLARNNALDVAFEQIEKAI